MLWWLQNGKGKKQFEKSTALFHFVRAFYVSEIKLISFVGTEQKRKFDA